MTLSPGYCTSIAETFFYVSLHFMGAELLREKAALSFLAR